MGTLGKATRRLWTFAWSFNLPIVQFRLVSFIFFQIYFELVHTVFPYCCNLQHVGTSRVPFTCIITLGLLFYHRCLYVVSYVKYMNTIIGYMCGYICLDICICMRICYPYYVLFHNNILDQSLVCNSNYFVRFLFLFMLFCIK